MPRNVRFGGEGPKTWVTGRVEWRTPGAYRHKEVANVVDVCKPEENMTAHDDFFETRAAALAKDGGDPVLETYDADGFVLDGATDGDQAEREDRAALRRVDSLSTELEDVTEVEYRQLRLERVVLAGIWYGGTLQDAENSLRELSALAETAGSTVLAGALQRRSKPDPSTWMGAGKAKELREIVIAEGADTVVADGELAPGQRRGLEDVVKVKVIDRTALILDIFAQHAKSREGKAQVELAQLQYLLPRLRGWGESMSRQAGGQAAGGVGIGSRGPGETKIELDRRRINTKIAKLKREIKDMKTGRDTMRAHRKQNAVPSVAIAGYTNAGKSSLLNRLTGAGVLVQNQLFATLDPTMRAIRLPGAVSDGGGRQVIISDTVGFVSDLPHELIAAFRATLEEVLSADLIVHVRDIADPETEAQAADVTTILASLGVEEDVPLLEVWNKIDIVDPEDRAALTVAAGRRADVVEISALTGQGTPGLIDAIEAHLVAALDAPKSAQVLRLPFDDGRRRAWLHAAGVVGAEVAEEDGLRLDVVWTERQRTAFEALSDPD